MKSQDLAKFKLPATPGVYLFEAKNKEILYVGKAASLKNRVRSYFSNDLIYTRGPRLVDMVTRSVKVDFIKTPSVLEALLLEAELIKKYQPAFNTDGKDDKSFNCVVITREDFPQVLVIRQKDLVSELPATSYPSTGSGSRAESRDQLQASFGPFPHGSELKEALKIIRRIFPFRDFKCVPGQGKPCFNRQIGLCPGVCTGEISSVDYKKTIKNIKSLFEGKKTVVISRLQKEMNDLAKKREFEKASIVKRKIIALRHIQDVALIKESRNQNGFRIEAYDVAHISGSGLVGAMTVVENGEPAKSEYRRFIVKNVSGQNDTASLKEIIDRRLGHGDWPSPRLIVVDGGKAQINAAKEVLARYGLEIPVVSVLKDERHRPKEILGVSVLKKANESSILLANAEAHRFAVNFHRNRLRKKSFS